MKVRAYCDGASRIHNGSPAACAFAVYIDNELRHSSSHFLGNKTNNFAEYMGLVHLLKWAEDNKVTGMDIYCDSQLVVNQVNAVWQVKHEELKPLHSLAKYMKNMGLHHLYWVRGHNGDPGNEMVDALCNKELDAQKESSETVQQREALQGSSQANV